MTARDAESLMLQRCATAANGTIEQAADYREAHVFRVAAMVSRPRFPVQSARLMQASERWFAAHPGPIMRKGWLSSLPRLRDMLARAMRQG